MHLVLSFSLGFAAAGSLARSASFTHSLTPFHLYFFPSVFSYDHDSLGSRKEQKKKNSVGV